MRSMSPTYQSGSIVPLHRRIKHTLLDSRRTRDPAFSGEQFSTVRALCKRFKTSRVTITKMIGELKSEGHVYSVPRRGVFWGRCSTPYVYRTLGVFLPISVPLTQERTPFYFDLFSGMQRAAARKKLSIKLLPPASRLNLDFLRRACCDGFVADGKSMEALCFVELCRKIGIPYLLLNRPKPDNNLNFLERESVENVRDMTRFLLERGHTQIGLIGFRSQQWYRQKVFLGYEQAMREAGVFDPRMIFKFAGQIFRPNMVKIRQLVPFARRHTALVITTASSAFARALVHALQEDGVAIPDDCSIITTTADPALAVDAIRVTNCAVRPSRIGADLIAGLTGLMEGTLKPPVHILYPTRIQKGNSVAKLRASPGSRVQAGYPS